MNTINLLGNSTMKLSGRFLITRGNASFSAFPPIKHHNRHNLSINSLTLGFSFDRSNRMQAYPFKISGFQRMFKNTQKSSPVFSRSFGHSRPFNVVSEKSRGLYVSASSVASKVSNYSTSVETRVNDANFERIYVQNGINVKPYVERIDKDENIVREQESIIEVNNYEGVHEDDLEGVNGLKVENPRRDETDIEKEAWRLLQEAVVTYCGSPIGTVAANDPGDKQPLNYDQVFIRDFVPSALAFLLKGEGEIVRNFLLHTLQLQVIINDSIVFCCLVAICYLYMSISLCIYILLFDYELLMKLVSKLSSNVN